MPGSMGEDGVLFQVEAAILREGLMQNASAQSEAQSASSGSWLYLLEQFDIGLVHLDRQLRVAGLNDYARRCLPVEEKLPFRRPPPCCGASIQF
jgi:hypothetical protein